MTQRSERVEPLLRELAAEFINRESNHVSLITVTRVVLSRDLKQATILLSVFPEAQAHDALNFLKRRRTEFREHVKEVSNLRHIPTFDFVLDEGEKHRQHIDALLQDGDGERP